MRDDSERVLDILEAIERIQKYTSEGRQVLQNELVQIWVVHYLQLIGEAARALSSDFRNRHSEINWPPIIGMRNILVHHYFEVDEEIVWSSVEQDLPELKAKLEEILRRSSTEDS